MFKSGMFQRTSHKEVVGCALACWCRVDKENIAERQ
jgi:hypothetical protein